MSLRQLTKQDTYFLVQYHEDQKFQVRRRGLIQSEGKIMTGQSYDVQWGRVKDVSSADVIASGTEEEMKELLLQRSKPETAVARQPKEQQPVTQTVPASKSTQQPSKETVPASKKRRQQQPKEKPAARVLFRSSSSKTVATTDLTTTPVTTASETVPQVISNASSCSSQQMPPVSMPIPDCLPKVAESPISTTAHQEENQSSKRIRPNPLDLDETLHVPLPTAVNLSPLCRSSPLPALDCPAPRSGFASPARLDPLEKPVVTLLNAINLNIEKLSKRQTEIEQALTRKLDTTNKRLASIEITLNTVLRELMK